MTLEKKLDERFQELLKEGTKILKKYEWDGQEFCLEKDENAIYPSEFEYNKWYPSAKNLIEKSCGKNSSHYKQIEYLHTQNEGHSHCIPACLGVLQSAYDDLKSGLLEDTKSLITAEVFTDFIEQAEYLLKEGYELPAAVIVRAVLDDGLRELCEKNGIVLPERPKLDLMNAELTKAGVYNKNVQKQITAWAGIGNSAAHMKIAEFKDTDVKNMIIGVINFNANYLR